MFFQISIHYRPIRLRTLKRELALRWLTIQHRHWFGTLVATLFGNKSIMRHVLTLKDAMYNCWSVYAKKMKLSLREA